MKTPRVSGAALRSIARFARTRAGGLALEKMMRADLHIDRLAKLPASARGDLALDNAPLGGRPPRTSDADVGEMPKGRSWCGTSDEYAAAYRAGRDPRDVVQRAFEAARALGSRSPSVGPLLHATHDSAMEEARASAERWTRGAPLGPLDGVPCAIKEQLNVRGLPRRSGSNLGSDAPATSDATCVARLREAGAIILGTTPMTEYGMTPTGANPNRTMPRNPHATDRLAGGSSTGSGVAVATGFVPFAIGADGGGSIRIPSSIVGVFGIKPTWGRVSRYGDSSGGSVAHVGPLASSTIDLARVLEVIGPMDPLDRETARAPAIERGSLERALRRGVRGLVIGIDDAEWRDASSDVVRACEEALVALEREGAIRKSVRGDLTVHAPAIGYVSIAVEARAGLAEEWAEHADEMGADLQLSFAAVDVIRAVEYVDAQRLRSGLRREVAAMFGSIDLYALPSTAITAPKISDAEMKSGFMDSGILRDFCRFAFLGNLTGLPASSAPVGLDANGLPIGFQLLGDAWDDATVLAATAHLERIGAARAVKPGVSVNVLDAK